MKLVYIYGPHASGKQTIAEEIAKQRNYRVFHNHELIGGVLSVLKDTKSKDKLVNKFRLELIEAAAKENIDVIATIGKMSSDKFAYFEDVIKLAKRINCKAYFVQLKPSVDTILKRVVSDSRRGVKVDSVEYLKHKIKENPDCFDKFPNIDHLTIDNSDLSAKDTADLILKYYNL